MTQKFVGRSCPNATIYSEHIRSRLSVLGVSRKLPTTQTRVCMPDRGLSSAIWSQDRSGKVR